MGGDTTAEHLEATFKRELRSHLSEVNRMMSTTSPPSIIGTQTIALQHFTSILPELAKIFTHVELVAIATTFANALAPGKGKIIIWKLIMYLQVVKGFLFDNAQSRSILAESVVIWIKPHFGRFDEFVHTQTNDSEGTRDVAAARNSAPEATTAVPLAPKAWRSLRRLTLTGGSSVMALL
jgi:dedicator of cytokinesis protein 3